MRSLTSLCDQPLRPRASRRAFIKACVRPSMSIFLSISNLHLYPYNYIRTSPRSRLQYQIKYRNTELIYSSISLGTKDTFTAAPEEPSSIAPHAHRAGERPSRAAAPRHLPWARRYRRKIPTHSELPASRSPISHQPPSFLEEIAASVSGLDAIGDRMRQRHFDDFARIVRTFGRPVTEGAPKTVRRQISTVKPLEHLEQTHIAKPPPLAHAGEDRTGQDARRTLACARPHLLENGEGLG